MIEVADNRRGIRVVEATGIRSLGLLGLRERALAGGELNHRRPALWWRERAARIPIVRPGKTS